MDVSQLQCMLDKAKAYGYKNAGFILDRGYFSRENIKYMDKCGYDFVIMIKGMKALVNDAVKEVKGTFEDSRQYTIRRFGVNGTTVEELSFHRMKETDICTFITAIARQLLKGNNWNKK